MYDMSLLEDRVCDELRKIAEKGISTSNLDATYKLVDIYKDIKEAGRLAKDDGYSARYARRGEGAHDDISRAYDRYMDNKSSYRYSGSSDCKARMMDTLEDYMDSFVAKMETMLHDTDCQEERDTINRYISKIKSLR